MRRPRIFGMITIIAKYKIAINRHCDRSKVIRTYITDSNVILDLFAIDIDNPFYKFNSFAWKSNDTFHIVLAVCLIITKYNDIPSFILRIKCYSKSNRMVSDRKSWHH